MPGTNTLEIGIVEDLDSGRVSLFISAGGGKRQVLETSEAKSIVMKMIQFINEIDEINGEFNETMQ